MAAPFFHFIRLNTRLGNFQYVCRKGLGHETFSFIRNTDRL